MFLFSASGLSAFYAVPEKQASKGIADWKMLRTQAARRVVRRASAHCPTSCSAALR